MKYEVFHRNRTPAHTCHKPGGFMIWWHRIKPGDMVQCKTCLGEWYYEGCFGMYGGVHEWDRDVDIDEPDGVR